MTGIDTKWATTKCIATELVCQPCGVSCFTMVKVTRIKHSSTRHSCDLSSTDSCIWRQGSMSKPGTSKLEL